MIDASSKTKGLARRLQALAVAGSDEAAGADARAAAMAAISNLSVAELQDLAGAHILFSDDAPAEIMVNFLLRQRLAAELLEKMGDGTKPYPLQPEKLDVGHGDRAPTLGTYQPPPPYGPHESGQSEPANTPAGGRSK